MSEITELARKQGKEMYELGKKHGAEEELRRIEKTITERLEAMKGSRPSDYIMNLCINECIHVVNEGEREEYEAKMDKWQKLKDVLADGKEHLPKDVYVSRPSTFEEILGIMEELEKRELSELKGE